MPKPSVLVALAMSALSLLVLALMAAHSAGYARGLERGLSLCG